MPKRIHLSAPDTGPTELHFMQRALQSGWVAPLGPEVDAFELEVAAYVCSRATVALASGTAALHLALLAMGIGPTSEVVVPTLTFGATAFPVTYVGASPVFLDSERSGWGLDPELLNRISSRSARTGALSTSGNQR